MNLISKLAPNWLTNVKVMAHHVIKAMFTLYRIDYRSAPKNVSDRPSVHI